MTTRKNNNQQIAREGRAHVEAELRRRGAVSVTADGTRRIYLNASNSTGTRTVRIQVKTKTGKSWHTTTDEGKAIRSPKDLTRFWVFVDLSSPLRYWTVPDWWMRNNIHEEHQKYLARHGGHRARTLDSNHHSIDEDRLEKWLGRWDALEIF